MISSNHSITFLAGRYISRLFAQKLPPDLVFHNFHHTVNVVRGVADISAHLHLTPQQTEILLLAAWFHDSGHIIRYIGHEEESQGLARAWLEKENYDPEKIEQVLSCIAATQLPQRPNGILEEVICDADLYHLSLEEYCHLQFQLREEFRRIFHKDYTDMGWMKENLLFIHTHHYFTAYGKLVLEARKLKNFQKCEQLVREYQMDS